MVSFMDNYNREKVLKYAKKWAYLRNPQYYNYENIGGDCTNFVSQCIYEGYNQMNYDKVNGWYYINGNNKSPSWTGVEFLHKFLVSNNGAGPKGVESLINMLEIGDVVQLSFNGENYSHSLVVIESGRSIDDTYIAAHTFDTFGRSVGSYEFVKYRCIHII